MRPRGLALCPFWDLQRKGVGPGTLHFKSLLPEPEG